MTTQIVIIREGDQFLYSRFEAGQPAVVGQRITAARARQIHEANEDAAQKGRGAVDFNGTGSEWERSYFVEADDGD